MATIVLDGSRRSPGARIVTLILAALLTAGLLWTAHGASSGGGRMPAPRPSPAATVCADGTPCS